VLTIEIDICARCHGRLRVIASIEDLAVIARILVHRDRITHVRKCYAPSFG